MPAYNAGQYLAEAIESVLKQTYSSWELLIVDDGSTDGTAAIAKHYVEQDGRIRYLYQQNAKQGRARNNGIAHAQGSLIAFLDADDLWLPHKLQVQVEAMQVHKVELVFSESYVFKQHYNPDESHEILLGGSGRYEGQAGVAELASHNMIPILTVIVDKKLLLQVGGFEESATVQYGEDYHLWLKLLLHGAVFLGIKEPLAAYRLSPTSVTATDNQNLRQMLAGIYKLSNEFPLYANVLRLGIRKYLLRTEVQALPTLADDEYFKTIENSLSLIGRPYFIPAFSMLRLVGARKLALRTLYFVLNHT
jgi:glycosyltransferase involved in cell wall biosynthesis